MNVNEYYQLMKVSSHNNSKPTLLNNQIQTIKEKVDKANTFLDNYFLRIKQKLINFLIQQINQFESSYEVSYQSNKSILSLLNLIINNYKEGNTVMYNNLINNSNIYIYECNNENDISEVINYFDNYSVIRPRTIDINKIHFSKAISGSEQYIYSLIVLNDGRIVLNYYQTINVSENFKCSIIIKNEKSQFCKLFHFENDNVLSTSYSHIIDIWFFEKNSYKHLYSFKDSSSLFVPLSNNYFASLDERTVNIWNNNYEKIKEFQFPNCSNFWLFYVKKKNYLLIKYDFQHNICLSIWNLNTYQRIVTFHKTHILVDTSFFQMDDNNVVIGGEKVIYIINLNTFTKEKFENHQESYNIISIVKLRDNYTVLCGIEYGKYCLFDTKTKTFTSIDKKYNSTLSHLISINDNTLLMNNEKVINLINY